MKRAAADLGRRRVCTVASAAGALVFGAAIAPRVPAQIVNASHGRIIPPVAVPDCRVRREDGGVASLAGLLRDRVTALHLMFTGCSSVCPIQGAIFQRVQALLPDQQQLGIQLVSLSIDPLADTPHAMQAWLERFDARAGWIAVAPQPSDLGRLQDLFGQGRSADETHVTQVNIINRRGELVFRTEELPAADAIAALLRKV